uniref:Secreted protein n=1 Tax=Panagrellus redivivus TaxID=6233 RepID=A0A7E4UNM6_PANRE
MSNRFVTYLPHVLPFPEPLMSMATSCCAPFFLRFDWLHRCRSALFALASLPSSSLERPEGVLASTFSILTC